MRNALLFALVGALLLFAGVTPAMASTYTFSFSSVSAPDQLYGSGTFDVTGGVIDGIDGWLFTYPVGSYQMTLIDPGGFASNDNVFTGITPFFTESGLSFTAGEMNYNIFNFTTEAGGYIVTGCEIGADCISTDPNGNPSTQINFTASSVPEPASLGLLGAGLVTLGLVGRRRRRQ